MSGCDGTCTGLASPGPCAACAPEPTQVEWCVEVTVTLSTVVTVPWDEEAQGPVDMNELKRLAAQVVREGDAPPFPQAWEVSGPPEAVPYQDAWVRGAPCKGEPGLVMGTRPWCLLHQSSISDDGRCYRVKEMER